jgi:putative thioredoxin
MLIARGAADDALSFLARVPETPEVRRLQAEARLSAQPANVDGADLEARLDGLLEQVRDDPASRQEFLDLLETLGPEDPRTSRYRKALSTRLF